jgi:hypothetical protein
MLLRDAAHEGESATGSYPSVDAAMSRCAQLGIEVVRTWAFSDGELASSSPPLQYDGMHFQESVFRALDYIVYQVMTVGGDGVGWGGGRGTGRALHGAHFQESIFRALDYIAYQVKARRRGHSIPSLPPTQLTHASTSPAQAGRQHPPHPASSQLALASFSGSPR